MNNGEFQQKTERIDQLLQRINGLADEPSRAAALDLLQSLMDLHGAAMARVVDLLSESEAGRHSLLKLAGDPLLCGLMVLYDLHPVPLEERLAGAVARAQTSLKKQGAEVELLGFADGVVRLKTRFPQHGCGSSSQTLQTTLQQAILEAVPEVVEIITEGIASPTGGFVPLNQIQSANNEDTKHEESAA
jgi:Fe-S cluster biogenesis protein NfuA